jgi:hypothetical protein
VLIAGKSNTHGPAPTWRLITKPFDRLGICAAVADALQGYGADPAAITGREPR